MYLKPVGGFGSLHKNRFSASVSRSTCFIAGSKSHLYAQISNLSRNLVVPELRTDRRDLGVCSEHFHVAEFVSNPASESRDLIAELCSYLYTRILHQQNKLLHVFPKRQFMYFNFRLVEYTILALSMESYIQQKNQLN